jgi:hypothetical protein
MRIVRVTLRRSTPQSASDDATPEAHTAAAFREAVRHRGGEVVGHVSTTVTTPDEIELAVFVPVEQLAWPARWNALLEEAWQQVEADGVTGWQLGSGFIMDKPW